VSGGVSLRSHVSRLYQSAECPLLAQSGHDSSYAITKFLFDLNQIQGSRAQTIVMISSRGQLRCTSTPKDIV
jgi:hypothetical protein